MAFSHFLSGFLSSPFLGSGGGNITYARAYSGVMGLAVI